MLHSPHPGILDVYEVAPGGATTEDPAIAYDTISEEPILNVEEPLVTYNGSSNSSLVPVLATCVPGTVQCQSDYQSTLIYQANGEPFTTTSGGEPIYWTFVLDPTAHFYDPTTHAAWGVYPTDVMFSEAREMAWSEALGAGSTPGWLTAQALLPNGSTHWDGGLHSPYNTTPGDILGSMLINDSAYCPAAAMSDAHGCITFVADGGSSDWPFFLQLIANPLAGAVVPCGWFTYETAGIPGWAGSPASHGDGPCKVPQLGRSQSTSSGPWVSYLSNLTNPTNGNAETNASSWDHFELELVTEYPAPQPKVQWSMVGSGPYYAALDPTGDPPGYFLERNPAYAQPMGCAGGGGLMTYTGAVCYPTPSEMQPTVDVAYEPSDFVPAQEIGVGHADFAQFYPTEWGEMISLAAAGKLSYYVSPSTSTIFLPIDLRWNRTMYAEDGLPGSPNIPDNFFSSVAARSLLTTSFPYAAAEATAFTVDGIPQLLPEGGPIPRSFGMYYPTNVSYPNGTPSTDPSVVGDAAWWWAQGTDPSSIYYDPELAACLSSPCEIPIFGTTGDPELETAVSLWIASLESITSGAVQPFPIELSFGGPGFCLTQCCGLPLLCPPGQNFAPIWSLGWSADDFAPSDYMAPLAYPDGEFPYPDDLAPQLSLPEYDNATACGHSAPTFTDLVYWAHQDELTNQCQGVAYHVADAWDEQAFAVVGPSQQALDYNLVEHILNALSLYLWMGEANTVTATAPWISGSSLDLNPLIGGDSDLPWFQVRYDPRAVAVSFREVGLPSGSEWSVTTHGDTRSNTTLASGRSSAGTVVFDEENGTIDYALGAPTGYGVAKVSGPRSPTIGSANVSGNTMLTVRFGQIEPVFFNESIATPRWPGLPSGTPWSVVLAPAGRGGPPGETESTVGSAVELNLTAGAHYRFHLVKPADYRDAGAVRGSLTVPTHPSSRFVRFAPNTAVVSFAEHGLAPRTAWSVVLSGPISETIHGRTAVLRADLTNGSYSFVIPNVGSAIAIQNQSGSISVTAREGERVSVLFDPRSPSETAVTFVIPNNTSLGGLGVNWWGVAIGNQSAETSNLTELTLYELPGTYTYRFVESLHGTLIVTFTGTVVVGATPVTVTLPP